MVLHFYPTFSIFRFLLARFSVSSVSGVVNPPLRERLPDFKKMGTGWEDFSRFPTLTRLYLQIGDHNRPMGVRNRLRWGR